MSGDAGTIEADISSVQHDISGLPSYQDNAPTQGEVNQAVASAQAAITSAVSAANAAITQLNGYETQAYDDAAAANAGHVELPRSRNCSPPFRRCLSSRSFYSCQPHPSLPAASRRQPTAQVESK